MANPSSVIADTRIAALGTYTLSGANTIAFAPPTKVKLKRLILVYTTGNSGAGNVLALQRRPVVGAASNQVALGSITTTVTIAAGQVEYFNFGEPYSNVVADTAAAPGGYTTANPDMPIIDVGEDFAIVSGGEGTSGVVNVYVEYVEEPFAGDTKLTRSA